MKTIITRFSGILMLAMMLVTLTSCEDETITSRLEGVWSGEVAQTFFSHRYGRVTEYTDIDMEFYTDPFATKSGRGVEIDYTSRYRYTECYFNFRVRDGIIYIDYEDGTNVAIRNYVLRGDYFSGVFTDYHTGERLADFRLHKIAGPRYYDSAWSRATPDECSAE